jgi:hypothetical protein
MEQFLVFAGVAAAFYLLEEERCRNRSGRPPARRRNRRTVEEVYGCRNLIRIIPGFSETIYDPHLEHFLGTSIGYHFEWAGSSIYIGQQIFVHKSSPSRRSSVQNNNILAIVLKRALGIRHSMAMVCLLLESTPCLLFIVILFFYLIKRSLKLGHVSMSTRPSATALPGSRVSGAL